MSLIKTRERRNFPSAQQQMCLTKSRCWEETETKGGILLVSLAKYERILFSVQLFRITGGHFNPRPRPRLPAAKYFEWDYWQLSDLRWAVCGTRTLGAGWPVAELAETCGLEVS